MGRPASKRCGCISRSKICTRHTPLCCPMRVFAFVLHSVANEQGDRREAGGGQVGIGAGHRSNASCEAV